MSKVFTTIQRRIVILLLVLLLPTLAYFSLRIGPTDIVVSEYESYKEAEDNSLFLRGWLPEIIPKSSNKIYLENNLDLNYSIGEFYFNPNEMNLFEEQLTFQENLGSKYKKYTYSEGSSLWEFKIDAQEGYAEYVLKIKEN